METIKSINTYELHKTKLDDITIIKSQIIDNYVKLFKLNSYCYSGKVNELNEPHGYGTMIYFNNDKVISYDGEFVNGVKNGNGIEYYKNGEFFTGFFLDGYKHGDGTMYLKSGAKKYVGNWENDKLIGTIVGYVLNNDKIIYYGELIDDIYNGYGIEYNNGSIIRIGYYKDGNAIKWLSFENNISSTKEIKIVDNIDIFPEKEMEAKFIISDTYNNKNITLDDIKKLEKYMVDNNSENMRVMIENKSYNYIGTVKFDGYNVKIINGKYTSNYGEKFTFDGSFDHIEDEIFITYGSITKNKKSVIHNYILNGTYDNLNVAFKDVNITYILNHTTKGMYYNLNHRYTSNEIFGTTKLIFDGIFENGKPKKGKIYKFIDENNKELAYDGNFKNNNNVSYELLINLHGEGIKYVNNKKIYEGEFNNGHYDGYGTEFDENECPQFIGKFSMSKRHGKGDICTLMNDGSYEIRSANYEDGVEINKIYQ
jgi:antitoxin component YwqK of YwqJK toxin-antitoxin module